MVHMASIRCMMSFLSGTIKKKIKKETKSVAYYSFIVMHSRFFTSWWDYYWVSCWWIVRTICWQQDICFSWRELLFGEIDARCSILERCKNFHTSKGQVQYTSLYTPLSVPALPCEDVNGFCIGPTVDSEGHGLDICGCGLIFWDGAVFTWQGNFRCLLHCWIIFSGSGWIA